MEVRREPAGEQELTPAPPPAPWWRGNVSIFETPGGGAVIAWRGTEDHEDGHHPVPAEIWGLISASLRGETLDLSPVQLARMLIKMMVGR